MVRMTLASGDKVTNSRLINKCGTLDPILAGRPNISQDCEKDWAPKDYTTVVKISAAWSIGQLIL